MKGRGNYEYTGTINSQTQMPEGKGELKYPNGNIYEGDFESGQRNGLGKLIFPESEGGGFVFGQV